MLQIDALDEDALLATIGRPVPRDQNIDDLGYSLGYELSETQGMGLQNLWETARAEFRVLICTDEPRYADVRHQAEVVTSKNTTAVVAILSAGLGAVIGVSATIVAPLVGLLLLAVFRLGKETFCRLPLQQP